LRGHAGQSLSPRPILYPQHGWARRVLDLDPRLAPAGTVGQVPPLRDDAFKPELASVLENGRAIAVEIVCGLGAPSKNSK
jgi:hypothetical protein